MTPTIEPQDKRRDKDFLHQLDDTQRKAWVRAIITRMASAWGVADMKAVALKIGCTDRAASNWVTNGQVPWTVIYTCHLETGASLDWIYNGTFPLVADNEAVRSKLKSLISEILYESANKLDLITPSRSNGLHQMADFVVSKIITYFSGKKFD